jgi:hypothetical protein
VAERKEKMANEGLIAGIFVFYAILGILLSYVGASSITSSVDPAFSVPAAPVTPGAFGVNWATYIWNSIGFFFRTISFSVSGLPTFVTLLIFTPLTLVMLWVLIQLIISIIQAVVP